MVRRVGHRTNGEEEESQKNQRGKTGRNSRKQQGCTISAKHVSCDNPVKYPNDKFWKLESASHHESLSSRSAGLSYLWAGQLSQTHKTGLDDKQCHKQLFLLLTHDTNSQKLRVRPDFVRVSNSKSECVGFVANTSSVTSLWRLQQFSKNCVIAEFVIHCVL